MDLRNNDNVNHRFRPNFSPFRSSLSLPLFFKLQTDRSKRDESGEGEREGERRWIVRSERGSIVRFGWFLAAAVRGSGHPKLERTRGGCSLEGGVGKGEIHDVNFNLIKA